MTKKTASSEQLEVKAVAKRWKPVEHSPDLWMAEYRIPSFICNSVAARLSNGNFLITSPGPGLIESFRSEIAGVAGVEFLLATSSYHTSGLASWGEAFPQAKMLSGNDAVRSLSSKTGLTFHKLALAAPLLKPGMELVETPGTRVGETWLVAQGASGSVWVVCDAFFNMERMPKAVLPRMMMKAAKSGPGLACSRLFRYAGIGDRRKYGQWLLERIAKDKPQVMIPAHGQILVDAALPERLTDLVKGAFPVS